MDPLTQAHESSHMKKLLVRLVVVMSATACAILIMVGVEWVMHVVAKPLVTNEPRLEESTALATSSLTQLEKEQILNTLLPQGGNQAGKSVVTAQQETVLRALSGHKDNAAMSEEQKLNILNQL